MFKFIQIVPLKVYFIVSYSTYSIVILQASPVTGNVKEIGGGGGQWGFPVCDVTMTLQQQYLPYYLLLVGINDYRKLLQICRTIFLCTINLSSSLIKL